MPKSTIVWIGKIMKQGNVLENARKFDDKWDNYALGLTIKPLSKKSGWRNIIPHYEWRNCCNNYER